MVSFRRIFWLCEPVFIMLSKGAVFVPFRGTGFTPVVVSIGNDAPKYRMYPFAAGTEFELPIYGQTVFAITGDTNATITFGNFSSSTSNITTITARKLGDSEDTTLMSGGKPSTFPQTFTGYEVYKIVSSNTTYKYKFTVNY